MRLRTISNVPVDAADQKRADSLVKRELRIGLFESAKPCAKVELLHKKAKAASG